MRIFFLVNLLPALLLGEELDLPDDFEADPARPHVPQAFSAVRKYHKEKSAIQARYRSRLADALTHADGAEILLLSFTTVKEVPDGNDKEYFPINPYDSHAKILQRKVLKADEMKTCRKATIELLKESEDFMGGAACHFPIHAVRLLRGEEVIFQTSLCWTCMNYYVTYPDDFDTATWVGFSSEPIQDFLLKELPISQSEIDRFKATFPTGASGLAPQGDKKLKSEKEAKVKR